MLRIGYIRVSTDAGEQLAALDNQRQRVQQAGVDQLIEDIQSGLDPSRPGYQELLTLIDRRKVASLVVTRVDRISRDAAECDQLIAFAAKRGVKIEALDGGLLESVTPQGFLLTRMATTMAEFESRMLSMRVRRGYEQCRMQKRPARGRCPWGYRVSADRSSMEADPVQWPRARQFLDVLRLCKYRIQPAMTHFEAQYGPMKLRSCRGVRGWLSNPALRGGLGYFRDSHDSFRQVVWGVVPALLDPVEWLELEQRLRINRERRGAITHFQERLLTGLCVCSSCGYRMGCRSVAQRAHGVVCGHLRCCYRGRTVPERLIAPKIIAAIRERLQEQPKVSLERDEVLQLRQEVGRLTALADPDYRSVLLLKQARLDELQSQCPVDLLSRMQALYPPSFWADPTTPELRQAFVQAVGHVLVEHPDSIKVELRF